MLFFFGWLEQHVQQQNYPKWWFFSGALPSFELQVTRWLAGGWFLGCASTLTTQGTNRLISWSSTKEMMDLD